MKKLKLKVVVMNMIDLKGKIATNQFIIQTTEGLYFQSYNKVIALKSKEKVYLDKTHWNCSKTTGIYRNIFLKEGITETRKKIESGEYILADLN